ncbi:MFS transporter, partial [Bacillus sp. HC-Mk]
MGKDIRNHSKWFVFTLCFIVLLGPMNAVLFNVALEDIANDLSISQSKVSWVVVGYSLVVGIGSIIYGKLADRYSVKRLLIISIIVFVIAPPTKGPIPTANAIEELIIAN